jgi:hypothetical protein
VSVEGQLHLVDEDPLNAAALRLVRIVLGHWRETAFDETRRIGTGKSASQLERWMLPTADGSRTLACRLIRSGRPAVAFNEWRVTYPKSIISAFLNACRLRHAWGIYQKVLPGSPRLEIRLGAYPLAVALLAVANSGERIFLRSPCLRPPDNLKLSRIRIH